MYADVHAHLTHEFFKNDLPEVILRAKDVIIHCAGSGIEDNKRVLELTSRYPNVRASLGLYPWDAVRLGEDLVDINLEFIRANASKLVCIGEVGLDFFEGKAESDLEFQEWVFNSVLELAEELTKPVIIHSRAAEKRVLELLSEHEVTGVIHCYTGSHKLLARFLELGFYFSIPASVVRVNSFQDLVSKLPVDRILTETDSPYLAPVPGGRSEPSYVKDSVKKIAELKGLTLKKMEEQLTSNYNSLFKP
ncbi:MAG TPA: TatD family hydrolase [Candidatus Nanoarchaeia archaeon]|nr:TatD family hydrolase [Candidatus Nanoarchaeia archaeon]